MKLPLLGLLLVAALHAGTAHSQTITLQSCGTSCTAEHVLGETLLVVARDQSGAVLKALTVALDKGAVRTLDRGGITPMDEGQIPGGGSWKTSTTTYVTNTHIILVETKMFFDKYGKLVDVKVETTSIPRTQIQ